MLFNSYTFLIFLPIVFALYWFVLGRSLRLQNVLVVVASYVFYGWWDWRFLILMGFTSLWAYVFGLLDLKYERGARWRLALSCVINLGILGYFKYFNFFLDQAVVLLNTLGFQAHPTTLQIILPVGISFYTFQALSYTIDVYRKDIAPTKDPVAFFAFVSFFPQLVAGPIERATHLLPQFLKPREFSYPNAVIGCREMLWGFFKKMVVADNCAIIANQMLNSDLTGGSGIWIGMLAFTFQIYCDFSGYSDIARGCARLFGVNLMRNFAFPYFSRDIAEFWRRWHISLTTWFRDYVYIPLGGSRGSKWTQIRNTFVVFLISGFWHGANWTFIAWGVFHAACFLPLLLLGKNRKYTNTVAEGRWFPALREVVQMAATFLLAVLGWTFFRAQSIPQAVTWLTHMFANFSMLRASVPSLIWLHTILGFALLVGYEWVDRGGRVTMSKVPRGKCLRWGFYVALMLMVLVCSGKSQSFIYFQF